jgi:stage IV sporulation protein FB
MLQFFKKIPISIHPLFWVMAGLLGWLNSGNLNGTILWVVVIFVSVLFHEMGHALTARLFGQKAKITLVAFGGVTAYESKDLKFWKQFLIVLNGPLFGILLFFISTLVLFLNFFKNPYLVGFFKLAQLVNIFWSIVNLLPVLPLDGGQLLRIALEGIFGVKGFKLSLFIGMVVSLIFCIFFFVKGGFLIGALFFLFSFQSFEMWRKSKFLTQADRNAEESSLLEQGEKALEQGNKIEAKEIFQKLREDTLKGLLYNTATQYLALIKLSEGEKKEAYQLLLEIKEQLSDDAKCILHSLAFEEENYPLVAEYSALCYQQNPSLDIALKNAKTFAILNQSKPSGGWLQTASQYESFDLKATLEEKVFENVLKDEHFKHFIKEIEKSFTDRD